jgi:two-component system, NtrC family, sensor kinase
MKLARKLTMTLILGILAVMASYAYLQVRQEVVLFEADFERMRRLGRMMRVIIEAVWQTDGETRVRQLIDQANESEPEINIEVVSFDQLAGDPQRVPLSAADLNALAAGDTVRRVREDKAGQHWRESFVPLTIGTTRPAAIELRESLRREQTYIRTSHLALVLATLAIVTVCGLIATGLQVWFVGRPLQQLRDKARRAGAGDFSGPLILRQHDEIGELAQEFNAMCDRLADANQRLAAATEARIAALEQLRHTDRLATVGQLAAGVAHELGTPLSVVSARAQLLSSAEMARADVVTNATIIVEQADRMTEIIQQLLDFSRRRAVKLGLASLQHIVTRTLDLLSSVAERSRVSLQCEAGEEPLLVRVDPNQMQQALTNVVLNGIQAMPQGGTLRVRIGAQHACPPADPGGPAGMYRCVSVEDQGSGISAEQIERIFEPFFTTKAVGEGTGLGLAVAHGIVAEHGGWITVSSVVGTGSRFAIYLPEPASAQDTQVAS